MPEKTGIDFMEHLKKENVGIPILAITGGVENAIDDYVNFASLIADKAVAKPLVKDNLIEMIKELTEQ